MGEGLTDVLNTSKFHSEIGVTCPTGLIIHDEHNCHPVCSKGSACCPQQTDTSELNTEEVTYTAEGSKEKHEIHYGAIHEFDATFHVAKVSVCHTSDCPSFDKVTDSADEVGVHWETYFIDLEEQIADKVSTIDTSVCIRKANVSVTKEDDIIVPESSYECTSLCTHGQEEVACQAAEVA